jgi:hypothetical protein
MAQAAQTAVEVMCCDILLWVAADKACKRTDHLYAVSLPASSALATKLNGKHT